MAQELGRATATRQGIDKMSMRKQHPSTRRLSTPWKQWARNIYRRRRCHVLIFYSLHQVNDLWKARCDLMKETPRRSAEQAGYL